MNGTHVKDLDELTKQIWQWCELKGLWIYASYIASKENSLADKESRKLETENQYQLSDFYFNNITKHFGSAKIHFFVTRVNSKCERYVCWLKALMLTQYTLSQLESTGLVLT